MIGTHDITNSHTIQGLMAYKQRRSSHDRGGSEKVPLLGEDSSDGGFEHERDV